MTKTELKAIVYEALKSEYGFGPKKSDIVLLEASGDGTYILFRIGSKQYKFDSYIMTSPGVKGTIWVGSGTIERTA